MLVSISNKPRRRPRLARNLIQAHLTLVLGKWQIILTIFVAELATETKKPHYYFGGPTPEIVFPPIDFSGVKPETLKVKQDRELNNGRLAMIAIIGFISEKLIPGAVPAISGIAAFH